MNENNEFILELYKNCQMGMYSISVLLDSLKKRDNKIKSSLEEILKEYERYYKKCESILKRNDVTNKFGNFITKISSNLGIKFETLKDNSDSSIASMVIEGLTMGINDMNSSLLKYKDVCKRKYVKLCKDYISFHEIKINDLEKYL